MYDNSVFSEIKRKIDIKSVAERYGLVFKKDFCHCPFHAEDSASFSINEKEQYFYCFGCQTGGDVIKLTELLFNISAIEAAKKLNDDFALSIEFNDSKPTEPKKRPPTAAELQRDFDIWVHDTWLILNGICWLLTDWKETLLPSHPRYKDALQDFTAIEGLCDIFLRGKQGIQLIYKYHKGDIKRYFSKYEKFLIKE